MGVEKSKKWLMIIAIVLGCAVWLLKSPLKPELNQTPEAEQIRADAPASPIASNSTTEPKDATTLPLPSTSPSPDSVVTGGVVHWTPPTPERIHAMTERAWLLPKKEVLTPAYNQQILDYAKSAKNPEKGWHTRIPLRTGTYDVFLDTIEERPRRFLFKMGLGYVDGDERLGMTPKFVSTQDKDGKELRFDYASFVSRFKEEEPYGASLSFPMDTFWKKIADPSPCQEMLIIQYIWNLPTIDKAQGEFSRSFTARAYCRMTAQNLVELGQMSFCLEGQDCG